MSFRLSKIKIGINYSTINPFKLDKVNISNDKAEQVVKAIHKTANTDKLGLERISPSISTPHHTLKPAKLAKMSHKLVKETK
jgi:hypothetical protein